MSNFAAKIGRDTQRKPTTMLERGHLHKQTPDKACTSFEETMMPVINQTVGLL